MAKLMLQHIDARGMHGLIMRYLPVSACQISTKKKLTTCKIFYLSGETRTFEWTECPDSYVKFKKEYNSRISAYGELEADPGTLEAMVIQSILDSRKVLDVRTLKRSIQPKLSTGRDYRRKAA